MLILGPLGEETTRRAQVLHWVQFLDHVHFYWWEQRRRSTTVRLARERLEAGAQPPRILEMLVHEGMKRCATRYPYVFWGAGPWDALGEAQVAGFWPKRDMLRRHVHKGCIVSLRATDVPAVPARGQQYWLAVEREYYTLLSLPGKPIWRMHGRWAYGKETWLPGEPPHFSQGRPLHQGLHSGDSPR